MTPTKAKTMRSDPSVKTVMDSKLFCTLEFSTDPIVYEFIDGEFFVLQKAPASPIKIIPKAKRTMDTLLIAVALYLNLACFLSFKIFSVSEYIFTLSY